MALVVNFSCFIIFSILIAAKAFGLICKLQPPEDIEVPNADNTSITVQWRHPTVQEECGSVSSYEIKYWRVNRNGTSSAFEEVNDTTSTRYDLKGLKFRQYYSLKMRSKRHNSTTGTECSDWSPTVTHGAVDGVPDKPRHLRPSHDLSHNGARKNITLTWDPPMNPNGLIIGYEVFFEMKRALHPHAVLRNTNTNETSVTITDLKKNTTYKFWVAARTRLGIGQHHSLEVNTNHANDANDDDVNATLVLSLPLVCGVVIVVAFIGIVTRYRRLHRGDTIDIENQERRSRYGSVTSTENRTPTPSAFTWDIDSNQLTFSRRLLTTKYSGYEVYKGTFASTRRRNKITVVIKTCGTGTSTNARKRLENESETLKIIGEHMNIIQLMGICEHEGIFHEVQEYLPDGTLHRYLRESGINLANTSELLLGIAVEIARGMEYIAQHEIVHRDLATENILMVSSNLSIKISGFSFATRPGVPAVEYPVNALTNWRHKSIESLRDGKHTTKSDVWSFGVVLWEILCPGQTPYVEQRFNEMKQFLTNGNRLPKPTNWHDNIHQVMLQCWLREPSHRPSFSHLAATLWGLKDRKQFYHNFMAEKVLYNSVNMEEYELINSGEYEEYTKHDQ